MMDALLVAIIIIATITIDFNAIFWESANIAFKWLVFHLAVLCELKHASVILCMLVTCTQYSNMLCANFSTLLFVRFTVFLGVSVIFGKLKYASQFPVKNTFKNTDLQLSSWILLQGLHKKLASQDVIRLPWVVYL